MEALHTEMQALKSAAQSQPKVDITEVSRIQKQYDDYVANSERVTTGLQFEITELKSSLSRFNEDLGQREAAHRAEIMVCSILNHTLRFYTEY